MKLDDGKFDAVGDWARAMLGDEHDLAVIAIERGEIVAANGPARRLFGRDTIGMNARALFDAGSWSKLDSAFAARQSGGYELQIQCDASTEPRPVRFVVLRESDARHLLVAPSSNAASYSEKQGRALMSLNDELTVMTRALSRRAHDLAEAREKLEHLDALRQELMATLAHDLKSPLAALRLMAAHLVRRADTQSIDAVRAQGARLDRAVTRMLRLIDTVLAAARLEAQEPTFEPTTTALDELARDTIDALEPLAEEAGVRLVCETAGNTTVRADATWMSEVFVNLVANAVRHAPRGSAVRIALTGNEASVTCAVVDSGPGVPSYLREAIFERFRQAGTHAGSAGLGLHVAHRIVELHGGRIWVEEAPGGGARFCFEIPKRARESSQVAAARDAHANC